MHWPSAGALCLQCVVRAGRRGRSRHFKPRRICPADRSGPRPAGPYDPPCRDGHGPRSRRETAVPGTAVASLSRRDWSSDSCPRAPRRRQLARQGFAGSGGAFGSGHARTRPLIATDAKGSAIGGWLLARVAFT